MGPKSPNFTFHFFLSLVLKVFVLFFFILDQTIFCFQDHAYIYSPVIHKFDPLRLWIWGGPPPVNIFLFDF